MKGKVKKIHSLKVVSQSVIKRDTLKRYYSNDVKSSSMDFASAVLLTMNLKKSPWLLSRCKRTLNHMDVMQLWMRKSENLKVVVKLISNTPSTRYLLVLSETNNNNNININNEYDNNHNSDDVKSNINNLNEKVNNNNITTHTINNNLNKNTNNNSNNNNTSSNNNNSTNNNITNNISTNNNTNNNDEESIVVVGVNVSGDNVVTVGLVFPVTKDMDISLDGDGGFVITLPGKKYNFEPVSVQEMWTAVQALVKAIFSAKNRKDDDDDNNINDDNDDNTSDNNNINNNTSDNNNTMKYDKGVDINDKVAANEKINKKNDDGDDRNDNNDNYINNINNNNTTNNNNTNVDNDLDYYQKQIKSNPRELYEWQKVNDELASIEHEDRIGLAVGEGVSALKVKIRRKLQEILMSVDLDTLTSVQVRTKLEDSMKIDIPATLGMKRSQYKQYIDEDMIIVMRQMDSASRIEDHLYLGSEWNASNLEELRRNGIAYILNVTREIDNFFPGMFKYCNVRLYDHEDEELITHWNDTYKFISEAREKNVKVLVHCKMGVSRSASTVMAYLMKANHYTVEQAYQAVKTKRSCVQPNPGFMNQLITYQGILDASNQRHSKHFKSRSIDDLSECSSTSSSSSSSTSFSPSFKLKGNRVKMNVRKFEVMESNKYDSNKLKIDVQLTPLPSPSAIQKSISLPTGDSVDNARNNNNSGDGNNNYNDNDNIFNTDNITYDTTTMNDKSPSSPLLLLSPSSSQPSPSSPKPSVPPKPSSPLQPLSSPLQPLSSSSSPKPPSSSPKLPSSSPKLPSSSSKFVIVDVDTNCLNVAMTTVKRVKGSFDRGDDDDYAVVDESMLSSSSVLRQWSCNCKDNPHSEADGSKSKKDGISKVQSGKNDTHKDNIKEEDHNCNDNNNKNNNFNNINNKSKNKSNNNNNDLHKCSSWPSMLNEDHDDGFGNNINNNNYNCKLNAIKDKLIESYRMLNRKGGSRAKNRRRMMKSRMYHSVLIE